MFLPLKWRILLIIYPKEIQESQSYLLYYQYHQYSTGYFPALSIFTTSPIARTSWRRTGTSRRRIRVRRRSRTKEIIYQQVKTYSKKNVFIQFGYVFLLSDCDFYDMEKWSFVKEIFGWVESAWGWRRWLHIHLK